MAHDDGVRAYRRCSVNTALADYIAPYGFARPDLQRVYGSVATAGDEHPGTVDIRNDRRRVRSVVWTAAGRADPHHLPISLVESHEAVAGPCQLAPTGGDAADDDKIAFNNRRYRASAVSSNQAHLLNE